MKSKIALGMALILSQTVSAFAENNFNTQDVNQVCFEKKSDVVGKVLSSTGNVFTTVSTGLTQVDLGTQLFSGSVLTTGSDGSASVTLANNETLVLESNSRLSIIEATGEVCASLVNSASNAATSDANSYAADSVNLGNAPVSSGSSTFGASGINSTAALISLAVAAGGIALVESNDSSGPSAASN